MKLYNAEVYNPLSAYDDYDQYDFDYAEQLLVVLKDGTMDIDRYFNHEFYINGNDVKYFGKLKLNAGDEKIEYVNY